MVKCASPGCGNKGTKLYGTRKYCHCHVPEKQVDASGIGRQNRNGDTTTSRFKRGGKNLGKNK